MPLAQGILFILRWLFPSHDALYNLSLCYKYNILDYSFVAHLLFQIASQAKLSPKKKLDITDMWRHVHVDIKNIQLHSNTFRI